MKTWYVDVYRFNEGVTDIQAQSITMVGEPNEVFTDYKLSQYHSEKGLGEWGEFTGGQRSL